MRMSRIALRPCAPVLLALFSCLSAHRALAQDAASCAPTVGRLVSVPTDAGRVAWNEAELEGESPWIGRRGHAVTDLRPAGKVRVGATVLDVVSDGDFVPAGTEVEVVRAEGRRLTVAAPRAPRS